MNTKAIEKKLDELFIDYTGNVPGAAVGIISNGELYSKCYGLSNLQESTSVTPQTNFEIASLTKAFTAACILKLVQEGKLSLNNTINDFIPDFPEYGRKIIVKHLLQHTSGTPNFDYPNSLSIKDFMNKLKAETRNPLTPGSKYEYCNAGYLLLGIIISNISGQPLHEYLDKTIFKPLQMSGTLLYVNGVNEVKNRAYGYSGKDLGYKLIDENNFRILGGAAGIYSSVFDMAKWDRALYTEKILGKETLEEAFTPGKLNDGSVIDYGYGWFIDDIAGFRFVYHAGGNPGFKHFFGRLPEKGLCVIILTNCQKMHFIKNAVNWKNELLDLFRFI
ncbi:beta-lactamase family protein [Candidatus Bathyarchaeota archaeon]|nr:beta-lactamase family protein [Candidatus Bathyarchaeota archaeon]